MFWDLFVLSIFATSPILTAVVTESANICSSSEFSCGDGTCVSLDSLCDGLRNCADGSDETTCNGIQNDNPSGYLLLDRTKRQAQSCAKDKWQCRDGTCINFDGKCDGMVDCPDASDETHPLCRNNQCQVNWFRCTYGACVDGTAPCNGVQECADNSDELLPRCRNETNLEYKGEFRCQNGQTVSSASHCDGIKDCEDGSDENVRSCADKTCASYLFQCAYGACVDQGSDCNGIKECADGSDESTELCKHLPPTDGGRPAPVTPSSTTSNCILPQHPEHGRYELGGTFGGAKPIPGQGFYTVRLNFTCNSGYGINGESSVYCLDGSWSLDKFPECVRFCRLKMHPSVEYRCYIPGVDGGTRPCNNQEPARTVAKPVCNAPNYYSSGALNNMHCIDGFWDYQPLCNPECGTITPKGQQLVVNGTNAKRGELPWHAGIYNKVTTPYMQICGGSLVSANVVISAAHCFWDNIEDKVQPASMYAVAVGKLYRPWNDPVDVDAQKSDVSDIKIPSRFQGVAANFQSDIAVLQLKISFKLKYYVRPVCLDFEPLFEKWQLQAGTTGKVAGWGLTSENGVASPVLKVIDLPFVPIDTCITASPTQFRAYITSDKICAGFGNGTGALCKGDSGGGLVFSGNDKGKERYYLRGIVSTAPNNDHLCNTFSFTTFTQITQHETFIKEFWHL